jgi:hypothetical protein
MATFTVTTAADVVNAGDGRLSLREAVAQANATTAADTIDFGTTVEDRMLLLTGGELVVNQDLRIDGDQDNDGIEIALSGGDTSRILNITGGGTDVRLDNLTLTRGSASDTDGWKGGAILLGGGNLSMTGCTVSNNTSTGDRYQGHFTSGGGIHATAGGRLTIIGCSIVNNESSGHYNGWGGGISGTNATMTIRDSQLSGNIGYYGGSAISWSGGSLTIENCNITSK